MNLRITSFLFVVFLPNTNAFEPTRPVRYMASTSVAVLILQPGLTNLIDLSAILPFWIEAFNPQEIWELQQSLLGLG